MTETTTTTVPDASAASLASPGPRPVPLVPVARAGLSLLAALFLLVLADLLVFGRMPGLGLVALFAAVAAAVLALRAPLRWNRPLAIGLAVFGLGLVPLVEAPHVVPVFLALVGLTVLALAAWHRMPAGALDMPMQVWRFVMIAPFRMLYDTMALTARRRGGAPLLRALATWIVPGVLGLVFLILFSDANPVLADLFGRVDLGALLDPNRVLFWLVMAGFIWPFLVLRLKRRKPGKAMSAPVQRPESALFGRAAILNSLVVFNLMFAVQSVMDITYLWAGVALPDGLTYADYAHRGAYPLVVTALLAAGFVLAAMRRGGAGEQSPLIRALVYLFIGQNVLLVVSSILRLDLYVSLYSLTELRVAAMIWMGLVAVGLVLILLRIRLNRSNRWLIALNLYALTFTLFVSSVTDFSALIADFNVTHSRELSGQGIALDIDYFGTLGPGAIPALDRFLATAPMQHRDQRISAASMRNRLAEDFAGRDRDWRSWTFRDLRLARYLDGQPALAVSDRQAKN